MLIEEIDEKNFLEKNEEGRKRIELKIKRFENQIEKAAIAEKKAKTHARLEGEGDINWNLFFDPTLWAYKHLKDKQNNPLILRGFQDTIINDKHRFVNTVAANQLGKTWTACIKAIHHALFVNNASVLVISRSEQQAIMILDEIKWMMKRAALPFDTVIGDVENRTELHLINADKKGTSVIRCLPPTLSALAYPATLIIPDEEDFWVIDGMTQLEFFQRVVLSRTFETKSWKTNCICGVPSCGHFTMGQIFAISNPNMEGGLLWNQYQSKEWHSYRFNFLANPNNTLEEYEKAKEELPSDIFNSTMAAVFSSGSGGFITEDEWKDAARDYQLITPARFFLGGDFAGEDTKGRDVDQSVLAGAESLKVTPLFSKITKDIVKICYLKEFPLRTKKEIIYSEISMLKEQIIKFAYDKVGVGDSVKNDLKERGILSEHQIEALTYSLPNKSEVYYNLKHLFEQRKIIVPNNPKLKEQLLGLRFEKTEGGYIKVHHKTEALHDDFCFIEGTKILTNKGQIPIEKLKVGDSVMTRKGYKKIIATGNRMAKVITKFGLTGTPDHPIITKKGIKKFIYVKASDELYSKRKHTVQLIATQRHSEGYAKVYNLTVQDANEYFANNILVHNCDALSNACYAARILKGAEPYIGIAKKSYFSENALNQGSNTLICPRCEEIDYKGQAGYYKGKSPTGQNFERIMCPIHA